MASLQLKLLGGFSARLSSGQAVLVRGNKNQALLAYLAMNPGRGVAREKLINVLWGDHADSQARSSLRQALFSLRRDLAGLDPAPLDFSRETISTKESAISTDVVSFARLATSSSIADLSLAAKLYEGDFLDGVVARDSAFEEWMAIERARFREVIIDVLRKLLPHLTGSEALASATQLLAFDPLRESSHRALMLIYLAQGQPEPAMRQYHVCRDILWRELQVRPSTEIENLYRKIAQGRNQSATTDNVQRPLRTNPLRITTEVASSSRSKIAEREALGTRPGGRPSIVVLPFVNTTGDPAETHFSDGVTDDLATALSRFRELHVIARESTFEFRRKIGSPEHVARRLGARFIVAGSMHRSGEHIRIRVQLVDPATGNRLWADRFDVNRGDAFAIEDGLIDTMAAAIAVKLEVVEVERAHNMRRQNMAAYECLLRGRVHARNLSYAETLRARYWFEKALEHDPSYASALAMLARSKSHESLFGQSAELVDEAMSLARRAVALDPSDSSTHRMLATVHLGGLTHGRGSHAVAAQELDMALRLNPNDPDVMVNRALQYTYSGQPAAALRLVEKAERLSLTVQNGYLSNRGFALFELRRYAEAVDALERVTSPAHWDHYYLAACYANLGRQSEARLQIAKAIDKAPFLTLNSFARRSWYLRSADLEHALDGFQKAGLPV